MPPEPPREQGPPGLATPSQINATPTSKSVENPASAKDLNSWPPHCKTSALIIQPHCLLKRFMQLPKLHTLHRPKLSIVLLYYVHT